MFKTIVWTKTLLIVYGIVFLHTFFAHSLHLELGIITLVYIEPLFCLSSQRTSLPSSSIEETKKGILDYEFLHNLQRSLRECLITMFFEQLPEMIENLDQSFQNQNIGELVELAHSIKGSTLSLEAKEMTVLATEIQGKGSQSDLSDVKMLIDQLEKL